MWKSWCNIRQVLLLATGLDQSDNVLFTRRLILFNCHTDLTLRQLADILPCVVRKNL